MTTAIRAAAPLSLQHTYHPLCADFSALLQVPPVVVASLCPQALSLAELYGGCDDSATASTTTGADTVVSTWRDGIVTSLLRTMVAPDPSGKAQPAGALRQQVRATRAA